MELVLEKGREVQSASRFFKNLRIESMQEGKRILRYVLQNGPVVTLTQLLVATGYKEIENGNHWGWSNLRDDLLSNKYGVAALYNQRHHRTEFTLRLPPIEDLTPVIEQQVEEMKARLKALEHEGIDKNMFHALLRVAPPTGLDWCEHLPPILTEKAYYM